MLRHPEVASRSCEDCAKFLYDDNGGQTMRAGLPMVRPDGMPTPCWKCPKTAGLPFAEKTRKNARELGERGWQTYQHYLECRAVGSFPDDPIVRMNAAVIRKVEDDFYLGGSLFALQMIGARLGIQV